MLQNQRGGARSTIETPQGEKLRSKVQLMQRITLFGYRKNGRNKTITIVTIFVPANSASDLSALQC